MAFQGSILEDVLAIVRGFTWADGLDLPSEKLVTRWTARLRKVEMSSSSS